MSYFIFAYSSMGVSITKEVLEDIGYTVIRKAPLKIINDFHAGVFEVDVELKTCTYSQAIVGYGKGRYLMEQALNDRKAFRASLFIQKYQKREN